MGLRNRTIIAGLLCMAIVLISACSAVPSPASAIPPAGSTTQAEPAASPTASPDAAPTPAGTAPVAPTAAPAMPSGAPAASPTAIIPIGQPSPAAVPTPTVTAPATPATANARTVAGVIVVGDGSQLERDIIPQLARVYSLSVPAVKAALAAARPCRLIADRLEGFRRMEGIIPPGRYDILAGTRIESQVDAWIGQAEARYDILLREIRASASTNGLSPSQHLILASMVEAECLADAHEREVATVFLNRLDEHGRLQSCVTVEYAVGYQRPYLLKTDIQADSPYNTYHVAGLPPGPIAAPDDNSLRAAIARKLDSAIHYFYYDYLQNDLFFFVQYSDFSRAAARSKEAFITRSPVGRWDRINKQTLYGR